MIAALAKLSKPIINFGWHRSSRRPMKAPVITPGKSKQRMTRPTAAPDPVNCNTNQSNAMIVNWSPRYETLSPNQSRWKAGWRNGAITHDVLVFHMLSPGDVGSIDPAIETDLYDQRYRVRRVS